MAAQKGFTFPDVLVGVLLLSLGILATAGMQTRAVRDMALGEAVANASLLAASTLDELAATPYAQCVEKKLYRTVGRVEYELEIQVTEPGVGVKDVVLTVNWADRYTQKYRLTRVKEK